MKKHFSLCMILGLLWCVCIALFGCAQVPSPDRVDREKKMVNVMLMPCDGIDADVYSLRVERGERAVFPVKVDHPRFMYLGNNAEAVYDAEAGTLTLSNVRYPTVIECATVPKSDCHQVHLHHNPAIGSVSITEGEQYSVTPQNVTVSATPHGNYLFFGWSVGGYLRSGGTLISTDPQYSMLLEGQVTLYANFDIPELSLFCREDGMGTVGITDGSARPSAPVNVTLRADVTPGHRFLGWSRGGYIDEGGDLCAFDNEYTFYLDTQIALYANFEEITSENLGNALQLRIEVDGTMGEVTRLQGTEFSAEPQTVALRAEPKERVYFSGWSTGNYLVDGGKPLSYDADYTFLMDKSTILYANFERLEEEEYLIVYHTNGGAVVESGADTFFYKAKFHDLFGCQQVLHNNGTFAREGHTLVGYSTAPVAYASYSDVNDIPNFSNVGGICDVPRDIAQLHLYLVWAKETSPADFVFDNGTITGYRGDDALVVVPERINGTPVHTIAASAFVEKRFERLVLPKTLTTVAADGFSYCKNIREIVFYDSITSIGNDSFSNCPMPARVVISSQRLPHYLTGEGLFSIKFERVRYLKDQKKIIVVSGSSSLNGLVSPIMEEQFPGYEVINYGTNMENSSPFFLEAISHYISPGDIVIHAPEFIGSNTMGGTNVTFKLFRANEQCYDIFRMVDLADYTNFWNGYKAFKDTLKPESSNAAYQIPNKGFDHHGDLTSARAKPEKDSFGNPTITLKSPAFTAERLAKLHQMNDLIKAKGGTLLMSFATLAAECVNKSYMNQSSFDAYTAKVQAALSYPVISNVGTYIMEHKYFFNSQWHCTREGAELRTVNLSRDLKQYLDSLE